MLNTLTSYYPQALFEECKYIAKETKGFIIKISSISEDESKDESKYED